MNTFKEKLDRILFDFAWEAKEAGDYNQSYPSPDPEKTAKEIMQLIYDECVEDASQNNLPIATSRSELAWKAFEKRLKECGGAV